MRAFVSEISDRAVAMTGSCVVFSKRLASWRPIPREEGEMKVHGWGAIIGKGREAGDVCAVART